MSKQDESVQFATVQVERSYDMRAAAILHFNTARKDGKDLDDALDAAWRAMLSKSASPEQNDFDALRAENERLERRVNELCVETARATYSLDEAVCELAALKAVPDGVEVVGYRWLDTAHFRAKIPAFEHAYGPHKVAEWHALMTVAQHNAIVAEKDHHLQLLGQLLGDCISAAGITRPDAPLSGPELLMFGNDLLTVLTDMRESVADEREASLAERMKAAGMMTVEEMLAGAPLDRFIRHAGVCDLATYGEWLDMKCREFLAMQASRDLDKREGDDLYEWVVAHSAVFQAARINFKAALSAPAAAPDVSALVETLEAVETLFAPYAKDSTQKDWLDKARDALAAHKAGGGDHE